MIWGGCLSDSKKQTLNNISDKRKKYFPLFIKVSLLSKRCMAHGKFATSCLFLLCIALICDESRSGDPQLWKRDRFKERDFFYPATEGRQELLLKYLNLTLDALEEALLYLNTHIDKINLDGIIGPRYTESTIGFLVSKHWTDLPPEISRRMKDIVVMAGKFSNAAQLIVKKTTPYYYNVSHTLIEAHFNDLFFPPRPINISLVDVFYHRAKPFKEEDSDKCMKEFIGAPGIERCQISARCFRMMTERKQRYYSLTHEAFYLFNGIQAGCLKELNEVSKKETGIEAMQLMDYFCANVYKEALQIEGKGLEKGLRDLFMEQIGLCGSAGYIEIGKWRWLSPILKWQRPSGCYGIFKNEQVDPRNFDPNSYGKYKRSVPSPLIRRKRSEQLMSGTGCLAHRTSVAIAALNTYVRRLVGHVIGETV